MPRIFIAAILFTVVFSITFFLAKEMQEKSPSSMTVAGSTSSSKSASESQSASLYFEPWQSNFDTFNAGYKLMNASEPKYQEAVDCFEKNIQSFPKAIDLDYSICWAGFCLAKLGKFEESIKYYQLMRENFYGIQTGAASGAQRLWETRLQEIRTMVETSSAPKAIDILQRMKKIDADAEKKFGPPTLSQDLLK